MPPLKHTPNKAKKCIDCQGLFDTGTSLSDHRCDPCFREEYPNFYKQKRGHVAPKTIGKQQSIKEDSRAVITVTHQKDGTTQTHYSYPKWEPPKEKKSIAQQVFESIKTTFVYPPMPSSLTGTKRAAKNMVKRMKRNNFPLTEEQYVTLKNVVARMKGRYE
jgi:hypothetical protein